MKLLSFYNGLTVDLDSCVLTPPPVPPSAPTSVFTFTPNNGVPALTYTAQNPALHDLTGGSLTWKTAAGFTFAGEAH